MTITKPGRLFGFLTHREAISHRKFIGLDIALLTLGLLSIIVLMARSSPDQLDVWLNTLLPDRFAVVHESMVQGATEQLSTSALIAAMQDPDPSIRISAAQALGWRRSAEAADALLQATYDSDAHVQEEAIRALGDIGQIQALPRLEALQVVQGNLNVQLAALEAEDQLTGHVASALVTPRSRVQAVAVAPHGAAFAVISDDLYALNNNTWDRILHLPVSPNGLAVGPDGQQIYLASDTPGVYRSHDGGKTWERGTFREASTPLAVTAGVIDPNNPQQIYLALAYPDAHASPSKAFGILTSRDGGKTWQPVPMSPTWAVTRRLILDPATPNFIYGLTDGGPYRLALAGSTNDSQFN